MSIAMHVLTQDPLRNLGFFTDQLYKAWGAGVPFRGFEMWPARSIAMVSAYLKNKTRGASTGLAASFQ
jgi:hypothetical protein